jgi:hypothetical protein
MIVEIDKQLTELDWFSAHFIYAWTPSATRLGAIPTANEKDGSFGSGDVTGRNLAASRLGGNLVNITDSGTKPKVSSWFSLTPEEEELHLEAQRFVRIHIAEMKLHESEKIKVGRAQHSLYISLQTEIDSVRYVFDRAFLPMSPTMVDYLHLELLRMLANENAELLGPYYPGPMV